MHPLSRILLVLLVLASTALGIYEMTAKSPSFLGLHLPGWQAADRAEHSTRWNPPTGLMPLDKLLHETEEASHFYRTLISGRS